MVDVLYQIGTRQLHAGRSGTDEEYLRLALLVEHRRDRGLAVEPYDHLIDAVILLPEVDEDHLDNVLDRIEQGWNEYKYSDYVAIIYERETVSGEETGLDERKA